MNPDFAARLERWIDMAALVVCDEARPAIAAEIHELYTSAFTYFSASSDSEKHAHEQAMLSLGDPVTTGKKYERAYPTHTEASEIHRLLRSIHRKRPRIIYLKLLLITGVLAGLYWAWFRFDLMNIFIVRVWAAVVAVIMIAVVAGADYKVGWTSMLFRRYGVRAAVSLPELIVYLGIWVLIVAILCALAIATSHPILLLVGVAYVLQIMPFMITSYRFHRVLSNPDVAERFRPSGASPQT
jgi:hypothetical protein